MFGRIFLSLILTFVPALVFAETAATLQERYLTIYLAINDAEHLERQGDYAGAEKKFEDCSAQLKALQQTNPDWEQALVAHRLADCRAKIIELQTKMAAGTNPAGGGVTPPAPTAMGVDSGISALSERKLPKTNYPWKTCIRTGIFWIGEKGNFRSAWDTDWVKTNGGVDNPYIRNGFAQGEHASRVNPFYVALPFNDLTDAGLAQKWVPRSWQREPVDGKPVSACKDRWVWIKIPEGRSCYAQWEDVGPADGDDADYVFGSASPKMTEKPALLVSPAVAQYLGLEFDNKPAIVSWRFVDAAEVPPGQWLKYDEQAVIYAALHQVQKTGGK